MMAGFCTTYHQINHMNIKHIYSEYKDPVIRRKRVPNRIVTVREQDIIERRKFRYSVDRRCNEYIPELRISLPRAPAFREARREDIDEIVNRLSRPKTADSSPRRGRLLSRDEAEARRCKSASVMSKQSGSRPCSRDIDSIVNRLYGTHTFTSRLRSCSTV